MRENIRGQQERERIRTENKKKNEIRQRGRESQMGGREQRERACWLLKADTQRRETEKRGDFEEELGFFEFFFFNGD